MICFCYLCLENKVVMPCFGELAHLDNNLKKTSENETND